MKYKFTEKGEKYSIVSELNESQYIVQKVFVDGDTEIAKGELTAMSKNSLFDKPIPTWKEQYYEKTIKDWEKEKDALNKNIEKERSLLMREYKKAYELTKSVQSMCSDLDRNSRLQFVRLLDFLSGNIKWVVVDSYGLPELISFDELDIHENMHHTKDIEIKLITLYGRKDGGLQYRINEYRDGSGYSKDIYVFCDYEEAVEKMKELIPKYRISEKLIELADQYNVELDKEAVDEFYEGKNESIRTEVLKLEKRIGEYIEQQKNLLIEKDKQKAKYKKI